MTNTELKKGSGQKPLWSQLFEILKERIAENVYEAGSVRFPALPSVRQ